MPIRNPFRRAGGAETVEENRSGPERGFFNNVTGSGSKPVEIKEPVEYKLSGEFPTLCFLRQCPPRTVAHCIGLKVGT